MSKLLRNPKEKEKIGFWLLNPASKTESFLLSLFFLILPTQLGKHFWPNFSIVSGIRIDYLSPIIYVTDILLVLLFGCFVYSFKNVINSKIKRHNAKLQLKSKKLFLFSFIFLFFVFNIFFAQRPLLSLYGFIKFLEYGFLVFYLAKTVHHRFQLQHISLLFSISALFESTLAIFQYLNQGSLNGIFYFLGERTFTGTTPGIANVSLNGELVLRPYATFPHPNVLAGFLLLAIVLVWSFVLPCRSRWMQILAVASLLLSSIALLLTFSRVTILIWGLLVFFILLRKVLGTIKTLRVRVVVTPVALVCLLLLSMLSLTHEIYSRFAQTSLYEESVTERTELLSASWAMIQQHLFFGVGLDNFIPALAPLQKPLPLNLYLQPVHTIFVLIIAETGIVGFCLFVSFLFATFIRVKKQEVRIKRTFFVLFLIIFVTGFFDHYWLTLQQGQLFFAVLIGLSWAKISKNEL